ncbi:hypothetical protein VUR80DRAFT_9013 [Thermomyces stellatus]
MDSDAFREAAKAVIDDMATYHDTVSSRPVISSVSPGYLRRLLPSSPPEEPERFSSIRDDVASKIMPGISHWQSPNFMAFFPCSSSFPGTLAELYSAMFNGAHFNWICSPAVTELETIMLDWLAEAMGLPSVFRSDGETRGGGVIQGSASEAVLTVMVAARDKFLSEKLQGLEGEEREEREWDIRSRLVAVASETSHSCTKKAARILGVRFATVPIERATDFTLTAANLDAKLAELRAKGLLPFYLTATFGTTDTCAVDDFAGVASLPSASDLWIHMDGAYAGAALLCPEHRSLSQETLSRLNSIDFNPHKWLLTNFDCSALWVRNRAWLVDALSINPAFLRNDFSESGLVTDYRDWQIPLGRRFRSLKLWFVMRTYGLSGLRAHLRGGIRRAEGLAEMIRGRADLFEIVAGPRFGLVVIRVADADGERANALTKKLSDKVFEDGEIWLTPSHVGGLHTLRICVSGPQVQEEHVRKAFEIIVRCAEAVRKEA